MPPVRRIWPALAAIVVGGAVVALLVGVGSSSRHEPASDITAPDISESEPPDASPDRARLTGELGTISAAREPVARCPVGAECTAQQVECPGLEEPATAEVSIEQPVADASGAVVFLSGGRGEQWWSAGRGSSPARQLFDRLLADGISVIQVRWVTPWLASAPGEAAGPAALACRPATVLRWLRDTVDLSEPAQGACGFCATGNSAGASQLAYALERYDLTGTFDRVVLTSGPPHVRLAEGCLGRASDRPFWYTKRNAATIDLSYGFPNGGGPCERHDEAYLELWEADGLGASGDELPDSVVRMLLGRDDMTPAVAHAEAFAATEGIEAVDMVDQMPHTIQTSPRGLEAIERALLHVD